MGVFDYQELLRNPAFGAGMGLLADDKNPAQGIMTGLLGAYGQEVDQGKRQREESARQAIAGLLGQPGGPQGAPQAPQAAGGMQTSAGGAAPVMTAQGPMGQQPPGMPTGFQGGNDQMRQLYGTMAQYANNPAQIGQGYAAAVQNQQRIDLLNQQYNDPTATMLRIYGTVNPSDFKPQSMQKFEDNRLKTGRMDFDLLDVRDEISSVVEKEVIAAGKKAYSSEMTIGRLGAVANKYDAAMREGRLKGAIPGGIRNAFNAMFGTEDEFTLAQKEFSALRAKGAVDVLPPGSASDADVNLALSGWPTATADQAYISSFLRGMQKLQVSDYAKARHDADYMSRNLGVVGMAENWAKNRGLHIRQAWQNMGLNVYAPTDASGKLLGPREAAWLYHQNKYNEQTMTPPQGLLVPSSTQQYMPPAGTDFVPKVPGATVDDPYNVFGGK